MKQPSWPLALALVAFASPPTSARAEIAIKPSFYPNQLDLSLDGRPLVERLQLEVKARGADLPVPCEWQPSSSADVQHLALACRAGDLAAILHLEQPEAGVLVASVELSRETPLGAEDGVRLTSVIAGFQKGMALVRSEPWWMRPVFFRQQSFLGDEGQLVLAQRAKDHVALLPLGGGGAAAWAKGANVPVSAGGITVALQAWAPWSLRRAPLMAIALGESPYPLVTRVYRQGLAAMGNPGRLRTEKPYPEPFTRIGFCTWNSFYEQQTTANLRGAAQAFKRARFPLGFFIIDAGWQDYAPASIFFQKLRGFPADATKIPGGLKALVAELKQTTGARWIGAWHSLQGVPGGIDPASPLARDQRAHLEPVGQSMLVPDPTSAEGEGFYRAYYQYLKDSGIDLIKVDFQNWLEFALRGRVPVFQGVQQSIYNFHAAAKEAFADHVINCMSMGSNALFSLRDTNVVRNSLDYLLPEGPLGHRRHVLNNVFNSIAVQQVAYPDFDMWEAYGDFAVYHSVLRALSGGPVYFTGDLAKQDFDLVRRLILADGTVLRADEPALPTRDVLFLDAGAVPVPLKAFTRVGVSGVIGAFNAQEDGLPVAGVAQATDVEGLAGDRFAVLEYFSKRLRIAARDEAWPVRLEPNQTELYWIVPIEKGAAVFGLVDKYVAPRTVLSREDDGTTLRVRVAEGGRLAVHLERAPTGVKVEGRAVVSDWRDGLLIVTSQGSTPRTVEISR